MSATQEAQRAKAAIRAAEARRREKAVEIAEIERQRAEEAEKLARMEAEELADETARIIGGPDAPPEKPKRLTAITNIRRRRAAYAAAVEVKRRELAAIVTEIDDLQTPLATAALHVVAEVQGDAIADIRTALAGILEPAARLFAADQVHAALLGTGEFRIPPSAPVPIRGQVLLAGIFKSTAPNIRPEGLDHESIFQAARAISQSIIAEINEGTTNA